MEICFIGDIIGCPDRLESTHGNSVPKKISAGHRRIPARGTVRLQIQAPEGDTQLIRALAETLRGEPKRARILRATLKNALIVADAKTVFDVFGSELPDEAFADVFDQPRAQGWRETPF